MCAPSTRLGSGFLDEDMFAGSISLYVVYRRGGERPLDVGVSFGCLGMCAEIIAEYQQCLPPRTRRLHHMHMMGPRARRPLSEEQLAREPRQVLRHVIVAKRPDRLDPSILCLLESWYAK